jgi:hypothetical protein
LRDAIGKLSGQERRELAESMVAELAEGHELPGGFDEQLLDAMLGALIAGKRGERENLGSDGVLGELTPPPSTPRRTHPMMRTPRAWTGRTTTIGPRPQHLLPGLRRGDTRPCFPPAKLALQAQAATTTSP